MADAAKVRDKVLDILLFGDAIFSPLKCGQSLEEAERHVFVLSFLNV